MTMPPTTLGDSEDDATYSSQRHATRFEPARREACLAWDETPSPSEIDLDSAPPHQALRQFALLLDISQTGASIALDLIPRHEAGVWFRLEGQEMNLWNEAKVVGVTSTTRGPHVVRLAFRARCDFETLRVAVCG